MRIIQVLPSLASGDAVGNDVRAINKLLNSKGYDARICCENLDPRIQDTVSNLDLLSDIGADDVVIHHMAIGWEGNLKVAELQCRKTLVYHNITPPSFFVDYNASAADLCRYGLQTVKEVSDFYSYALADSGFNKQNLRDFGYTCPIDVRPILIPFEDYKKKPDESVIQKYNDGWTNLLFVGRIAPNKKQEDIIAAFDCYKKNINPKSRLILVGSDGGLENYKAQLDDYIKKLGVEDVIFPGHISFAEILGYYSVADVFVCMSEHEGFCVPLVEAMCFGVPIVAYNACAVPETLGKGGILLDSKDPALAAAAIDRLVKDERLRDAVIAKQKKRLEDFSYERVSEMFLKNLEDFIAGKKTEQENER